MRTMRLIRCVMLLAVISSCSGVKPSSEKRPPIIVALVDSVANGVVAYSWRSSGRTFVEVDPEVGPWRAPAGLSPAEQAKIEFLGYSQPLLIARVRGVIDALFQAREADVRISHAQGYAAKHALTGYWGDAVASAKSVDSTAAAYRLRLANAVVDFMAASEECGGPNRVHEIVAVRGCRVLGYLEGAKELGIGHGCGLRDSTAFIDSVLASRRRILRSEISGLERLKIRS